MSRFGPINQRADNPPSCLVPMPEFVVLQIGGAAGSGQQSQQIPQNVNLGNKEDGELSDSGESAAEIQFVANMPARRNPSAPVQQRRAQYPAARMGWHRRPPLPRRSLGLGHQRQSYRHILPPVRIMPGGPPQPLFPHIAQPVQRPVPANIPSPLPASVPPNIPPPVPSSVAPPIPPNVAPPTVHQNQPAPVPSSASPHGQLFVPTFLVPNYPPPALLRPSFSASPNNCLPFCQFFMTDVKTFNNNNNYK